MMLGVIKTILLLDRADGQVIEDLIAPGDEYQHDRQRGDECPAQDCEETIAQLGFDRSAGQAADELPHGHGKDTEQRN